MASKPLFNRLINNRDVFVAVAIIGIIIIMIIPLSAVLLDMLIITNIAVSLSVMLVAMYNKEPLDFSVFPSLLLVMTLFRLALNISSTRLILLHAHAGQVIQQFGQFVIGVNPLFVFLIF